jgi:hypothetical protein
LELAICGSTALLPRAKHALHPPPTTTIPTLECRAASLIAAGCEVHNTYGEHGAAELAARYGFALAAPCPGPFDAVGLRVSDLLAAARAALPSARALRARTRLLASTDLLDGEEPLEVCVGGVVGAGLRVVLRVLGATEKEMSGWGRVEDALSASSTAPVGPLALSGAATADPPLTPAAARVLTRAVAARLGEYGEKECEDGVRRAEAGVAAAADVLEKAAAAAGNHTSSLARAGEAMRAARALLTARIVVRAEKAVLRQAVAGAARVC